MNKILLTGSSGILGSTILKKFDANYNFLNLINKNKINYKYNQIVIKNNFEILKKIFAGFRPDIIIHAAANTNIEDCQKNKKNCKKVNFKFTKNLVKLSKLFKVKFIYISTDQVYNKNFYQKETSKLKSYNYYTDTKILSENLIKSNLKDYTILRTNFFGKSTALKKTFSEIIVQAIQDCKKIYLFDDIYFNPINIDVLTRIIGIIIDKKIKGIFNVGTLNGLSKYKFGLKIAKIFSLNSNYIIKDSFLNRRNLSKRPLDMRMDVSKIKKIIENKKLFNLNYNLSLLIK